MPNKITLPARPQGLRFRSDRVAGGLFAFQQGDGVIEIFDVIGEEGATPVALSQALAAIGARPVTVRINSPGGDYFDGVAMFNQLRQHGQRVTVEIMGLAASAASLVAMAGDVVKMAKNAEMMIHRSSIFAMGNVDVMAQAISILTHIDEALAAVYAERSGQSIAKVEAMMAAETYLHADQAIALKLADQLLDKEGAKPKSLGPAAHNRDQVVRDLRFLGYSKVAAKAIAGGGWSKLEGAPDGADITALTSQVTAALKELRHTKGIDDDED